MAHLRKALSTILSEQLKGVPILLRDLKDFHVEQKPDELSVILGAQQAVSDDYTVFAFDSSEKKNCLLTIAG